jgi:catechol 2,3-dioxygenase-like lactoylglutathione lyase family enzyme
MLREPPDSKVEAVTDVAVEGYPATAQSSRYFYVELLGLRQEEAPAAGEVADECELRFYGQRHRLILRLKDEPEIDTTKRAALICVRSLRELCQRLDDLGIEYVRSSGFGLADRRVWLRDPSGNLLELRQETFL